MRRTVFFLGTLLLTVLLFSPAQAARKLFIHDIALSGSCAKEISVEALKALLAQEMPRDILKKRDLAYEDLSPYLEANNWNATNFTVRETRNILRRLGHFDMKLMLRIEVSCLPGPAGRPTYVLTGRSTDLDKMDEILACQDGKTRDQRQVCHESGDVYDTITYAHVEMASFAEFKPAIRLLLARLLHIPEIEIRASPVYDIGFQPILTFPAQPNDEHAKLPLRYVQHVLAVPEDRREQICRDPASYWKEQEPNVCKGEKCREAAELSPEGNRPRKGRELGGPILGVVPYWWVEKTYLLRAEAIARETNGEISSAPEYRCLHFQQRRYKVGLTLRAGTPLPQTYEATTPVGPGVTSIDRLVFGIDLSFGHAVIPSRYTRRPGIEIAAVLGGSYVGGSYCLGTPNDSCGFFSRNSSSWTTELRGQVRGEFWRGRFVSLRLDLDVGLGLEVLHSSPAHSADGANLIVMAGVGPTLAGRLYLSSSWNLGWTIGVFYQLRFRTTSGATNEVITLPGSSSSLSIQNCPAVPQLWQPLWLTLGLHLASPLRPPS